MRRNLGKRWIQGAGCALLFSSVSAMAMDSGNDNSSLFSENQSKKRRPAKVPVSQAPSAKRAKIETANPYERPRHGLPSAQMRRAKSDLLSQPYFYEAQGNKRSAADAYFQAGITCKDISSQGVARKNFLEAVRLYETVEGQDKRNLAGAYFNAGVSSAYITEREERKALFLEAGKLYKSMGNQKRAADAYFEAGLASDDKMEKKQNFLDAAQLYKNLGNKKRAADAHFEAAPTFDKEEKKIGHFQEAGQIYEEIGDKLNAANAYFNIADASVYLSQKRNYLLKALSLYEEAGAEEEAAECRAFIEEIKNRTWVISSN